MFHHKVPDLGFRVSATAHASNPSGSLLEVAPSSNPIGSLSASSISQWLCFLLAVILNEGGVGP
jgi:hypothetical protein